MFADLAQHYFNFLHRFAPDADESVWLTCALAIQASLAGHTCLDLGQIAGKTMSLDNEDRQICLPELGTLKDNLLKSGVAAGAEKNQLFVLEDYLLYLRRYWHYENFLATELKNRSQNCSLDFNNITKHLQKLFPLTNNQTDWQRTAALVCALKGLCIISGGPGTGKTFTVARIIALLQLLASPNVGNFSQSSEKYSGIQKTHSNTISREVPAEFLRIGLCAPTGKAASRLAESIQEAINSLELPEDIIAAIPREAATIHRLLGYKHKSPYFRHNQNNKLNIDVLIVDEVSMVDLALMSKLMAAVPKDAKVILLGDKDQLSSVESGRIMADICGDTVKNCFSADFASLMAKAGENSPVISKKNLGEVNDCVVFLTKSYRFAGKSGIGGLATSIIAGEAGQAIECFNKFDELAKLPTIHINQKSGKYVKLLRQSLLKGYGKLFKCQNPADAFKVFDKFQVLTVLREGEAGVRQINNWIADLMRAEGLIKRDNQQKDIDNRWYAGRPIMITGNNYNLGLFNGDIGITMRDQRGHLQVYFKDSDGFRAISCPRLPDHETAFACTVHKSQGSEFNKVLLLLPARMTPILSRELLYTAVTRAKDYFELWGDDSVFKQGIERRVGRCTGLAGRL